MSYWEVPFSPDPPTEHSALAQLVNDMLCPNSLVLWDLASLSTCENRMAHCGSCGKPVLNRSGRVMLHGRADA